MLDHIKRREKKEIETEEAQIDMAEAATTKGSIFTHDIELANILRRGFDEQIKAGRDFAMNAAKLDAISQLPAGAGGGGSSTVMITNAPSTSNVANTKVETAAGVSDPHTQLAGVY
jgi:galactokinase/mevalonate kinase-like predicted kinase